MAYLMGKVKNEKEMNQIPKSKLILNQPNSLTPTLKQ